VSIIVLYGKNFYCHYMCPFGAVQELQNKLAGLPQLKVYGRAREYGTYMPPVLAFIAIILALITDNPSAVNYEPFSLIFGRTGVEIQWIMLPLTLFFAFFSFRFYCRFACPVGYLLSLMVRLRTKVVSLWKKIMIRSI